VWLVVGDALPLLAQAAGRFHLVRSVSGSRGTQDGNRFLIEDPRVAFQAGTDRQVLVLFEWDGPAGMHRCEGRWKDPSGNVAFTSASDIEAAGPRFGVYWGLSIPDTVAAGTWVLEAVIDGQPAGVHAFQVLAEAPPDTAPARRALAINEIYQRGLGSTRTLEVLDAAGARLPTTSGFFLTSDLVSTSFEGINGAHAVRVMSPDGRLLETTAIAGWNVGEDWALLRFPGAKAEPVALTPERPRVGDRAFVLDASGGSGRVIVDTAFIGSTVGGDFRVGSIVSPASLGAPVFNEYGEVVASIRGSGVAGGNQTNLYLLADAGIPVEARGSRARAPVSAGDAAPASRSLAELDAAGVFVRPLVRSTHAVDGVIDSKVHEKGEMPLFHERRTRFSRKDTECVVTVRWLPLDKEDTTGHFELYDATNRHLDATEPVRLKLRRGKLFAQYWKIPLAPLPPGLYRVDLVAGSNTVWRSFFYLAD